MSGVTGLDLEPLLGRAGDGEKTDVNAFLIDFRTAGSQETKRHEQADHRSSPFMTVLSLSLG